MVPPQPLSTEPQFLPMLAQVFATQPQTLAVTAPQVFGAVQEPQFSVPPQPFGMLPQFLPAAEQVVGVQLPLVTVFHQFTFGRLLYCAPPWNTRYRSWTPLAPVALQLMVVQVCQPPVTGAEQVASNTRLNGEPFNFSYGMQIEVIDIVRRIIEISGSTMEPITNDSVQAEIRHMSLSSAKARRWLGWRPRVGFEEGLRRTVAWYQTYFREKRGVVSELKA